MAGIKDFFSGVAKTVVGFIPGGSEVVSLVDKVLPNKLSEKERFELELAAEKQRFENEIALREKLNIQEKNFQDFTKDMEGTASDLKSIPYIGPLIILLRGAFRPLFSYAMAFVTIMVFAGKWIITAEMLKLLYAIDLIILTFYFGERAIKNILPLIAAYFGKESKQTSNTNALG